MLLAARLLAVALRLRFEVTKGHLPTTSCQQAMDDPMIVVEGPSVPYSPWNLQPKLN